MNRRLEDRSVNIKVSDGNETKVVKGDFETKTIKLTDIADAFSDNYEGILTSAIFNNKFLELSDRISIKDYSKGDELNIKLLDTTTLDGMRVYMRGLSFVFVIACRDVLDGARVFIEHSISGGIYCTFEQRIDVTDELVEKIKNRMREIIEENHEIYPVDMPTKLAQKEFKKVKRFEKADLLNYRHDEMTRIYNCCGYIDYFYGFMVNSTGKLKDFDLKKFNEGVVLIGPDRGIRGTVGKFKPQYKLSKIYNDTEKWTTEQGIRNVLDLNRTIERGEIDDMILTVEAYQSNELSRIAKRIDEEKAKIVQIAAPSSSGKTSFAHRLRINLKVLGVDSIALSTDDYFIDREKTPRDENGMLDYESLEIIDLEKLNSDLEDLLSGKEIDEIRFNFYTGKRELTGKKLSLKENEIVIIEGIHGLNPKLTYNIKDEFKFKIYLSVITQINLDDHNRIPTTDLRLLRRMVRDFKFRGYDARETINRWESVRRGEDVNIFPYQEEADDIFNSSCMYEISILKKYAKPLLDDIGEDEPEYVEARRLNKLLQYFVTIEDTSIISPVSILREFIGGSKIVD